MSEVPRTAKKPRKRKPVVHVTMVDTLDGGYHRAWCRTCKGWIGPRRSKGRASVSAVGRILSGWEKCQEDCQRHMSDPVAVGRYAGPLDAHQAAAGR